MHARHCCSRWRAHLTGREAQASTRTHIPQHAKPGGGHRVDPAHKHLHGQEGGQLLQGVLMATLCAVEHHRLLGVTLRHHRRQFYAAVGGHTGETIIQGLSFMPQLSLQENTEETQEHVQRNT